MLAIRQENAMFSQILPIEADLAQILAFKLILV